MKAKKKGTGKACKGSPDFGGAEGEPSGVSADDETTVNLEPDNTMDKLTSMFIETVKDMFRHLYVNVNISINRIEEMKSTIYMVEERITQQNDLKFKQMSESWKNPPIGGECDADMNANIDTTTNGRVTQSGAHEHLQPNGIASMINHPQIKQTYALANDIISGVLQDIECGLSNIFQTSIQDPAGNKVGDDLPQEQVGSMNKAPSFSLGLTQEGGGVDEI